MADQKRRKASLNALKSLLPIVQENYRTKTSTPPEINSKRDQSTQCMLLKSRLQVDLAARIRIPPEAVFVETQIRRLVEPRVDDRIRFGPIKNITRDRRSTLVYLQEVGVQTCELNEDNREILVEKLASICINEKISPKYIANIVEFLSDESIDRLIKFISSSGLNIKMLCENLIKLSPEELERLEKNKDMSLREFLNPRRSVGLLSESDIEKRKQALKKFKKLVRMVLLNLEWFKALNQEYSKKREREKLLDEFYQHEENFKLLDNKNIEFIFNKDDFKAPRVSDVFIKDSLRHVLLKEPDTRTNEDCDSLLTLIASIPHLNSLPKQIRPHLARLLRLCVYDKGRVIIRDSFEPIYFYYIVSGGCDVLTVNISGLDMIKGDELQKGDIFGQLVENDDRFTDDDVGIKKTIVVNSMIELLVIDPSDIRTILDEMRASNKLIIKEFIWSWPPVNLWKWTETNINTFANKCELKQFDEGEIIFTNLKPRWSADQLTIKRDLFIVFEGRVDMVKRIETSKTQRKKIIDSKLSSASCRTRARSAKPVGSLFKVCELDRFGYFGFETDNDVTTWFLAGSNHTKVIRINQEDFLSVHEHSAWLLTRMAQDYEFAIPGMRELEKRVRELVLREQQYNRFLNDLNIN